MFNDLIYYFQEIKRLILENKKPAIFTGVFLFFVIGYSAWQAYQRPYYENEFIGYEISGPRYWSMKVKADGREVSFQKNWRKGATIYLDVEMGNPYGEDAVDYIANGIVPKVIRTFEKTESDAVHFLQRPQRIQRNGRTYGMTSFLINYDEQWIIYTLQTPEHVFALRLESRDTQTERNKRAFFQTLDALVVHKLDRENYFEQFMKE